MSHYRHSTNQTAVGVEHCFHGPGMPQYANGVHLANVSANDADRVASLLSLAYEAGRRSKASELRRALGAADDR
jgi:(2Fe-2S) ferredoxin